MFRGLKTSEHGEARNKGRATTRIKAAGRTWPRSTSCPRQSSWRALSRTKAERKMIAASRTIEEPKVIDQRSRKQFEMAGRRPGSKAAKVTWPRSIWWPRPTSQRAGTRSRMEAQKRESFDGPNLHSRDSFDWPNLHSMDLE